MLIPADRLEEVFAAVAKRPAGATFINVAAALKPTPPMRSLQRWLQTLVRQHRIIRVGKTKAIRYQLVVPAAKPPSIVSRDAEAIQWLVGKPIEERPPTEYHRVLLDSYRPNETAYVPAELRARMVTQGDAATWRTPAGFDAALVALVSSIMALEDAFDAFGVHAGRSAGGAGASLLARAIQPLTAADIVKVLRGPVRQGVRADVQLVWGIRAVMQDLVNRGPALALTAGLIGEVYAQVCRAGSLDPAALRCQRRGADHSAGSGQATPPYIRPAFLRTSPVKLPGTTYRPLADPGRIETCFDQVLRLASAIVDPVERSFYLLVHLLYLLPFETLNPTMALLTMNVPLLAAGLAPVTFAGVQPSDLMAAIRGVWELNRMELLREFFGGFRVAKT